MHDGEFKRLLVSEIASPRFLLRPVDKQTVAYLEIRDSIEKDGLIEPIVVRQIRDKAVPHEVVEGNYRFEVHKELGRTHINCMDRGEMSDLEVLAMQVKANGVSAETAPAEYANQLKRIQDNCPSITLPQLAALVGFSQARVSRLLGLTNLLAEFQRLVNRGDVPLENAYLLSKLPKPMQREFREQAIGMKTKEFKPFIAGVLKRWKEQVATGRLIKRFEAEFEPYPYLRSPKELLDEIKSKDEISQVIISEQPKGVLDAFILGLKWALHLDPASIEKQRRAHKSRSHNDVIRNLDDELDQ